MCRHLGFVLETPHRIRIRITEETSHCYALCRRRFDKMINFLTLFLFCVHRPHHIAGVFSVVGDGADDFGQPDQVEYGHGIVNGIKNLIFDGIF